MSKAYFFCLCSLISFQAFSQSVVVSPDPKPYHLFGSRVAIHENTFITATNPSSLLKEVFAFKKSGNEWVTDGKLVNAAQLAGDAYGSALSIYGDYAVVGASSAFNKEGRVYVFKRTGPGDWKLETVLNSTDKATGDAFGWAVSIYENTILVGAPDKFSGTGAAYIFKMTNGLWRQEAQLFSSNAPNGRFGTWLSLYGDYAVVSANQREKVFIYERDGSSWPQKITLNSPSASINFGTSVSVYKENLLVGAFNDDQAGNNAGAAFLYTREAGQWKLSKKLIASDAAARKNFGGRVAIAENYAVIGTLYELANSTITDGSAYTFKKDGDNWLEQEKHLTPSSDFYGWNVAIDNNIALVGAYGADLEGTDSGAAYLYELPEISGVKENAEAISFKIFPNPANNFIQLEYPEDLKPESVWIFNAEGKMIKYYESAPTQVPIHFLLPGSYYLKITSQGRFGLVNFVKN